MASRLPKLMHPTQALRLFSIRAMSGGQYGDGAGKGGGSGGAVRSAGGPFGQMEAAKEEQYFRQLQKEQIEKLKEMLEDEVSHHERQIRQHQEAIEHHKKKMDRLEKEKKKKEGGSDSD